MIAKTLAETPPAEAEWIMWVDIDTVIADMAIVPRFSDYAGKDLVVWGQQDKLMQGNLAEGACSPSLYVLAWNKTLAADVQELRSIHEDGIPCML